MAPRRSDLTIERLHPPGRTAIARDHEQRADNRQVLERINEGLGIFGRGLIPEIVEIESRRSHKEDHKNCKEPRAEIERDHQSANDLENSGRYGEHLRRGHSRHAFELRCIGGKQCRNDNLGGDEFRRGSNRKKLCYARIDKQNREQNSPENDKRWHGRPHCAGKSVARGGKVGL